MLCPRWIHVVFEKLIGSLTRGLFEHERGEERLRRASTTVVANVISKGLAFVALIYSTRVGLEHLGTDRFGVWLTVSSVATLLSFMDLGLSNALIGRVAAAVASSATKDDDAGAISAGMALMTIAGVLAAALLSFAALVAPWQVIFKGITPTVADEARATAVVFAVLFGLSLPAQAAYKIYAGLQRGWVAHIATGGGWLLNIVLVAVAPMFDAPMWFYLFAAYGTQQLGGLILLKGVASRGLLRWPNHPSGWWAKLRHDELYRQGRLFLVIQIALSIVWGSNQFMLSSLIGPSEASAFGVLQRTFMLVQVSLAILNAPLWAAYADARAHGETSFIRGLLLRSLSLSLLASVLGCGILIVAGDIVVKIVSNGAVELATTALMLMGAWTILEAVGNAFAMYLNGTGAIRPQAIAGITLAVVSVPLKAIAVIHFGLEGLLLAMSTTYVLIVVVPFMTIFRAECLEPLNPRQRVQA